MINLVTHILIDPLLVANAIAIVNIFKIDTFEINVLINFKALQPADIGEVVWEVLSKPERSITHDFA